VNVNDFKEHEFADMLERLRLVAHCAPRALAWSRRKLAVFFLFEIDADGEQPERLPMGGAKKAGESTDWRAQNTCSHAQGHCQARVATA
jgi:hypothetical protein